MSRDETLPAPDPNPETLPFWEGCRSGELRGQVCDRCGRTQLYPRLQCTECGGDELVWTPLSGHARVATFSVVRRPVSPRFRERVPFVLAIVRLAEGPQLMTHIVDCEPGDVAVGMPVVVRFEPRGEWALPVFAPAKLATRWAEGGESNGTRSAGALGSRLGLDATCAEDCRVPDELAARGRPSWTPLGYASLRGPRRGYAAACFFSNASLMRSNSSQPK